MKETKLNSISDNITKLVNNSNDTFKNCSVSGSLQFLTNALNSDFQNRNKRTKFSTYNRGRIIKVNFGLNIGAELSGPHYALVLTKNDNPYSQKITVIPFTSKPGTNHLKVNFNLSKELISYLALNHYNAVSYDNESNFDIFIPLIARYDFPSTYHPVDTTRMINLSSKDKEKVFNNIFKLKNKMKSINYLKLDNIATVSKFRIIRPTSKLDPLNNLSVYPDYLKDIDKKISFYLLDQ